MSVHKNKKRISITLDKELVKILEIICERHECNKSDLVTTLLHEFIASIYLNSKEKQEKVN